MRKLGKSPLQLLFTICFSAASFLSASAYADFTEGLDAYRNGDYAIALAEFQPLATQGHADAQVYLGAMYNNGEGVLKDYIYAHMWYNIGSANGADLAGDSRDAVEILMTPSQIEQAQEMARNCLNSNYEGCSTISADESLFASPSPSLAPSVLYKDGRYRSRSLVLPLNTHYRLGNFGFNDATSSLTVPSGQCVLLTKGANFEGRWYFFRNDASGLEDLNDEASSALAYEPHSGGSCGTDDIPILYEDRGLENRQWPVTVNMQHPFCDESMQMCTPTTSSLFVPAGMCVYLEGSNGVSQHFYEGAYTDLALHNLDNKVIAATVCSTTSEDGASDGNNAYAIEACADEYRIRERSLVEERDIVTSQYAPTIDSLGNSVDVARAGRLLDRSSTSNNIVSSLTSIGLRAERDKVISERNLLRADIDSQILAVRQEALAECARNRLN